MSNRTSLKSAHYSEAVRLRRQGFSYRAISAKTGVSKTQIHQWLRNFAVDLTVKVMQPKCRKTAHRAKGVKAPENQVTNVDREETVEQKLSRLERELQEARLQRDIYDEIINVAEKKFDIKIRKKAGTKH